MKRKIIRQGIGGNSIYLPKKWIEKMKIVPGDEIDVVEEGKNLVISAETKQETKTIETTISYINKSRLRTLLSALYRSNYQEIIIHSNKEFNLKELNSVVDSLTGFILIEQTNKKVHIKNTLAQEFMEVDKLIEKMYSSISYLFSLLTTQEANSEEDTKAIKDNIIRQRDFLLRAIINTMNGKPQSYELYNLVTTLEKIPEQAISAVKIPAQEKQFNEIASLFEKVRKAHLRKDLDKMIKISQELSALRKDNNKLPEIFSITHLLFTASSKIVSILIQDNTM